MAALGTAIAFPFRNRWRLHHPDASFLLGWFIIGYIFFSSIWLQESRHDITILFPVVVAAVLFANRLMMPVENATARDSVVLMLALVTFCYPLVYRPIPYIRGYREAACWVLDHAPKNSVILFIGQRDGTFIFDVRADERRRDVSILRADKVLLRLAVKREYGVVDRGLSTEDMLNIIQKHAVHYVVAQPKFWLDIPSMKTLDELLHDTKHFELAKTIKATGNSEHLEKEILIYRTLDPVAERPASISLELPGIGRSIKGDFGIAR